MHTLPILFRSVKTDMLEKGRRSDSNQLIPTRWGKTLFRYLLRASDIFERHHRCLPPLHVQIMKRMGKSLPDLCAPKAKLPTLNCWFLAKDVSSYATLHRLSRIGKQYANMLEEHDISSQVSLICFRTVLQPLIHLQLAVDNPINF